MVLSAFMHPNPAIVQIQPTMVSSYNLPDYVTKYFKYKQLDRIHGKPTVESILLPFRQIKPNAHTVCTTLGKEQLIYLALVISPTVYIIIPGTAELIRPTDSGFFTIMPAYISPATRANPIPVKLILTNVDIAIQKATFDNIL